MKTLKNKARRVAKPVSKLISITDVSRAYPSFAKGRNKGALTLYAKEKGLSVYVVKPSLIFLSRAEIIKGKSVPYLSEDLQMAFAKHRRFLSVGSLMEYANLSEKEATELLTTIHLSFNRIGMQGIPCTELDLLLFLHLHNLNSNKGY